MRTMIAMKAIFRSIRSPGAQDAIGRRPRPAAGRDGEHGFTLVEMLVVITIIGLIMGLIGPRVLNYLGQVQGEDRQDLVAELFRRA